MHSGMRSRAAETRRTMAAREEIRLLELVSINSLPIVGIAIGQLCFGR